MSGLRLRSQVFHQDLAAPLRVVVLATHARKRINAGLDETALAKRTTDEWLHARIAAQAVSVTGVDLSDHLPDDGLVTAIAVIDNRQSISANEASNEMLDNTASISDDVASGASGNLGFNVAAGDNNAQDNAASLSAADASFSFGMADAEVFVHQAVGGNTTLNEGVTNAAGLGGNAFSGASGNIGVNVASGNNNAQKNALAASVATAAMAQSSISWPKWHFSWCKSRWCWVCC